MRTRCNSVIQHVIAQSAVAIFEPQRAVAALDHELSATFLAQVNNELLPHNCEDSSLPKELTGHSRKIYWQEHMGKNNRTLQFAIFTVIC